MSNDLIQKILDASNGGLDIILSLVPDAEKCIDNNRHFKLRQAEKTASASLKKLKDGRYYVKDFGGDFSGGAINLYMYLENVDLKTALKVLGARFQVLTDGRPPEELRPKIEKRPATETEQEGEYFFAVKEQMSDFEIETLFAKSVLQHSHALCKDNKDWYKHLRGVCAAYSFFALTSFTHIKDRQAIVTSSTDKYPIFMIDGGAFKKIYQPKSLDKKYRFRYAGNKTPDHIFGLARFVKTFNDGDAKWKQEQDDFVDDGEKKKEKAFTLEEVIICSGDRDALNVAALGYNVIWQNSESAILKPKVYLDLKSKTKGVYNLPDLDLTGVQQAHRVALQYLDLKTIQLPQELMERRDFRGNPCKDVRDYLQYYSPKDFERLVKSALEYKFWDEEPQFTKSGEFKRYNYVFNHVRAYNFISRCGFHRIESKTAKNGYEYIRVRNNVVKTVEDIEIKAFVNLFLEERFTDDQRLRNTFYRSNQLKDESLNNLKIVELDFRYYDKDFQYLFFLDKAWKVTPDEIVEFRASEVDKLVWEEKVVPHKVKKLDAPFTITRVPMPDGTEKLDITIHRQDCLFFNYLVNVSRTHWRTELETRCELEYTTKDAQEKYRQENKFNIAGPLLTEAEREEQKAHLINKIYTLGYMLARYKEKSKPWAPFLMDHKLSAEGESHGGSGKSIFAKSVQPFMNFLLIDGKSKSLTDDKHAFENVTEKTEIILVDDLGRNLNLESFFSMISEGITVNPKYAQRFVLEYKQSPKFIFTSNYSVKDLTSSAERRLLYATFSDYYHANGSGSYREERTPANDFGKELFSDFTEEEWNLCINTMAYALQTYMKIGRKVEPPLDNVHKRNLQGIMGDAFKDWADVYFGRESGRRDTLLIKKEAFDDFVKNTNSKLATMPRFSKQMDSWCKYYGFILNPEELRGGDGRIIKKRPVKNPDGSYKTEMKTYSNGAVKEVNTMVSTEMLYVKTSEEEIDMSGMKEVEDPETPAQGGAGIITAAPGDDDGLGF